MFVTEKKRRNQDSSKRRKYVKSGRYALENAEDFVPDSWWRRNERDRRVAAAAMELLEEVGPERFTVVELARRLQMHRSTIYYSYGCKAELLEFVQSNTAHCRAGAQFREEIEARNGAPTETADDLPPVLNRMRQVIVHITQDLSAKPGGKLFSDLWLLTRAERLRSKRRPHRLGHLREGRIRFGQAPFTANLERLVDSFVNGAIHRGEIPAGTPANLLVGWVVGLVWYHLAVRGPWRDWHESLPFAGSHWESLQLDYALTCLLQGAQHTVPAPRQTPPGRRAPAWAA